MQKFNEVDTKYLLADSKFYESYSRYDNEKGRYETWNESVSRVMNMHREYYKEKMTPELSSMINKAETLYKQKRVLGAQRALQFGGEQIIKNPSRLFNCVFSPIDRVEFFGEVFHWLLSGAGAGFSVQNRHISKLPKVLPRKKEAKTYIVEDSIEGWASSLDVLLSSFFENGGKHPEYSSRKVYFDLSKVRPKGAYISGGFKAPGPEPLRASLNKVENILITTAEQKRQLKSIEIYDIIMHTSDAVLAGGVRRSATICLFDAFDIEMRDAKTGNWYIDNPQRGRSNNSAMIIRNETPKEVYDEIFERNKQFGEPGFIFVDDANFGYNPCVSGDTILRVKDHDVVVNEKIIAKGQQYELTMKQLVELFQKTGILPLVMSYDLIEKKVVWKEVSAAALTRKNTTVIKITDSKSGKSIKVTPDHKIWTENRGWVEAKDLKNDDVLKTE